MVASRSRRQGGLTLLEVTIASVILSAIVGMSAYLLWSSARHTETSEAALQLEVQAREFLDALTKELHQTKVTLIKKVDTAQLIPLTPAAMNGLLTPGTAVDAPQYNPIFDPGDALAKPAVPPMAATSHADADFDGIRFRLPGYVLDLTKNNANAEGNSAKKASEQTFELAKFKDAMKGVAGAENAIWLYEVQYWWEIDNTNQVTEGKAGGGPKGLVADGIDNNKDGVVDEGIIYKLETWYLTDGSVQRRTLTTALRHVKKLTFFIAHRKWQPSDWNGDVARPSPQRPVVVNVTLEKPDPKHPGRQDKTILKTLSTIIDVRN